MSQGHQQAIPARNSALTARHFQPLRVFVGLLGVGLTRSDGGLWQASSHTTLGTPYDRTGTISPTSLFVFPWAPLACQSNISLCATEAGMWTIKSSGQPLTAGACTFNATQRSLVPHLTVHLNLNDSLSSVNAVPHTMIMDTDAIAHMMANSSIQLVWGHALTTGVYRLSCPVWPLW